VRVRCLRAPSCVGVRGWVRSANVSGRAAVECRWKIVVLRARRWTSRWIWRQVRRVGRFEEGRRRGEVLSSLLLSLRLVLLLLLLLERLLVGLHCGGCWRGSSWSPFARGDSIAGTIGTVLSFTGGMKTSA
jgi:hypothetical protein